MRQGTKCSNGSQVTAWLLTRSGLSRRTHSTAEYPLSQVKFAQSKHLSALDNNTDGRSATLSPIARGDRNRTRGPCRWRSNKTAEAIREMSGEKRLQWRP